MYELACIIGVIAVVGYDSIEAYRVAVFPIPYALKLTVVGGVSCGRTKFYNLNYQFADLFSRVIR